MNEILSIVIILAVVVLTAFGILYLIVGDSWEESKERCENLSIQKNATSFKAENYRDCILKFCEESYLGNDTLLGKCYTEEWELEERE